MSSANFDVSIAYFVPMCNPSEVATRYHHGQLREALLTASRELLAESGAGGLSLRAAARRAGVSTAAPYRHFKDKQALLVALAHAAFVELDASLSAVEAALAPPKTGDLELVQRLGVAYVRFAAERGPEFRLMFGELAPAPDSDPQLAAATAAAAAHLPRAIGALAPELDGEQHRDLTLLAWSIVHGLSTLYLDGHLGTQTPARAEAIAERIIAQLGAAIEAALSRPAPQ